MPFVLTLSLTFTSLQVLAITNGYVITPEQAPAVALIEDLKNNSIGTGVFIGDGIILTAEHCVATKDLSSIRVNGKKIIKLMIPSPHIGHGPALDLALLQVEEVKNRSQFHIRKTQLPEIPIEVFMFGYGLAYTTDPGLVEDQNLVLRVGKNTLEPNTKQTPFNRGSSYLNLDFLVGPYKEGAKSGAMTGDSGGPLIYDNELIGITSKSGFGNSNYVNLQGPAAQIFFKHALSKGWKINQSSESQMKTSGTKVLCKKSVQGL